MIEVLVAHIEDKGFDVHVTPGVLLIRKQVGDQILGYDWAISQLDLQNAPKEALFRWADDILALLSRTEVEAKKQ